MSGTTSHGRGPIFLAGGDRSGIGLLGEILECHPAVSMTRRTDFWSYHHGRFGDVADPAVAARAVDAMMRDSRMRVLTPDRARLLADLAAGEPSYARLFELLQVQLMERRRRSRWGDKSLGSERFADTIFGAYPDARMVHVLRDPRDRYASQKHHRGLGRGGVGAGAAMWRWSERLASRNGRRFDGRYTVVRYEDLVTDPDRTLERVRGFLGLDVPAPEDRDGIVASPLTTTSIGRHRHDISPAERRFLELATGRGMRRWGYEPSSRDESFADRLHLWVGVVPVEAFRAAMWRPMTEIRHHRGRRPSDRRLTSDDTRGDDPT